MKNEPQPLSITASGGQIIDNNTLKKLISNLAYKYTLISETLIHDAYLSIRKSVS